MITMKLNDDKFGLHVSCNHVFCHFVFVCVKYRMDHDELLKFLLFYYIPWCYALLKSLTVSIEIPSAIEPFKKGSKTV